MKTPQTGEQNAEQNQQQTGDLLGPGKQADPDKVAPGPDPKPKQKGPKRQVTFKYGKGDRAKIIANGVTGEVTRMLCDDDRLLYEVRYSDQNNMVHDKWFTFEELEACAGNEP